MGVGRFPPVELPWCLGEEVRGSSRVTVWHQRHMEVGIGGAWAGDEPRASSEETYCFSRKIRTDPM